MLARNATRGTVLARRVRVARTGWTRFRGLMGVPALSPGEALLIERCRAIHTCFLRFAIDALFLDRRGCVVAAVRDLRLWRCRSGQRATRVLELPAGTLAATGTVTGDRVSFEGVERARLV